MVQTRHINIKPTYDIVAKKVLSNTEVTLQLIKDILDLPAVKATILDGTQIHLAKNNVSSDFYMVVDVLVELDDGSQVIIEIQMAQQAFFINRLWAYMCGQVSSNVEKLREQISETHSVYRRISPVYVIAILEENYFDDDRAIRTYSMRDDYTKEILKIGTLGIKEKRSIAKLAFLELKKYNPEMETEYNRKRWLEFFGNKPYTEQPGELLTKADFVLDLRTWSEEEKAVLDERIRQLDNQWETIETAKEIGIEIGLEEGRAEGLAEGIEKGKLETFISLVNKGLLSTELAAKELSISISEFEKYL